MVQDIYHPGSSKMKKHHLPYIDNLISLISPSYRKQKETQKELDELAIESGLPTGLSSQDLLLECDKKLAACINGMVEELRSGELYYSADGETPLTDSYQYLLNLGPIFPMHENDIPENPEARLAASRYLNELVTFYTHAVKMASAHADDQTLKPKLVILSSVIFDDVRDYCVIQNRLSNLMQEYHASHPAPAHQPYPTSLQELLAERGVPELL
jgi:hypothetical protein